MDDSYTFYAFLRFWSLCLLICFISESVGPLMGFKLFIMRSYYYLFLRYGEFLHINLRCCYFDFCSFLFTKDCVLNSIKLSSVYRQKYYL